MSSVVPLPVKNYPPPIISLDAERLLRRLGCTRKLRGFPYTVYMMDKIKADPDAIRLITKQLYREAADQFGVSDMAVERSVRTVVRQCWAWPDHTLLEHVAGSPLHYCPTNAEFLDMMADFLRRVA